VGTIWVRELSGGLDTRRMPETTKGGALLLARDGHINRGGEFEQRAAFVSAYGLPVGTTVDLFAGKTGLYVFGHAAPLGIPAGITYQRLQHPDGSTALVSIASADLYSGKIYAIGVFADGSQHHFYDGTLVDDWVDGRSRITMTVSGSPGGTLTALTVDGVSVISGSVVWGVSDKATALAIAAAINDFSSDPEYVAVVNGNAISILAAIPGTAANGKTVLPTVTGDLVFSPTSGNLASGAALGADKFQAGLFAKTIGSKMYALSGPVMNFSGVEAPTAWDTATTGAGFIDMSEESSGSEQLGAIAKYQQYVAIFAERTTQIWFVDPDPSLNKVAQVLNNTGTLSPRSVTQFGDSDVFFLDESGLRSLRARDSSNAAATSDIGIPIDTLIVDKLRSMTTIERAKVIGLIEPTSGRFWLIFPDEIFVYSFFEGSKISAWTTYTPTTLVDGVQVAFEIQGAVVFRRRVYLRSGDTVYAFGGMAAVPEYDNVAPEMWLPYLDGEAPTKKKQVTGIDVACVGEWEVRSALQPTNLDASTRIAVVTETTFNSDKIPAEGASSHISLRFIGRGSGAKKISSAVIHYVGKLDED
jgi:hypothetical protein